MNVWAVLVAINKRSTESLSVQLPIGGLHRDLLFPPLQGKFIYIPSQFHRHFAYITRFNRVHLYYLYQFILLQKEKYLLFD